MTELENYASVLYSKAPSRSNWPDSVGASIASAMDGFTEEIMVSHEIGLNNSSTKLKNDP